MPILGMRTPHYVWFLIRDCLLGSLIDIRFRLETSSLIIMHISFFILALWVGFALELVIFWWLPYVTTFTGIGWLSEQSEHFPMMQQSNPEPIYSSRNRYAAWYKRLIVEMHGDN